MWLVALFVLLAGIFFFAINEEYEMAAFFAIIMLIASLMLLGAVLVYFW